MPKIINGEVVPDNDPRLKAMPKQTQQKGLSNSHVDWSLFFTHANTHVHTAQKNVLFFSCHACDSRCDLPRVYIYQLQSRREWAEFLVSQHTTFHFSSSSLLLRATVTLPQVVVLIPTHWCFWFSGVRKCSFAPLSMVGLLPKDKEGKQLKVGLLHRTRFTHTAETAHSSKMSVYSL